MIRLPFDIIGFPHNLAYFMLVWKGSMDSRDHAQKLGAPLGAGVRGGDGSGAEAKGHAQRAGPGAGGRTGPGGRGPCASFPVHGAVATSRETHAASHTAPAPTGLPAAPLIRQEPAGRRGAEVTPLTRRCPSSACVPSRGRGGGAQAFAGPGRMSILRVPAAGNHERHGVKDDTNSNNTAIITTLNGGILQEVQRMQCPSKKIRRLR